MPIQQLDYPGARILMDVSSEPEVTYRVNAVKKEPWTAAFIESMEAGAVFWDVGANVGSYALIAAARGHQVVAVEPVLPNLAALFRNLACNQLLGKVLIFPQAAGADNGFTWLALRDLRPGATHSTADNPAQHTFHRQQVQLWTLDTLCGLSGYAGPRYLKIDVDGAELDVLRGAAKLLADPATRGLMIEMSAGLEEAVTALLTAAGFTLAARYDQRDGRQIAGVAYGEFRRVG